MKHLLFSLIALTTIVSGWALFSEARRVRNVDPQPISLVIQHLRFDSDSLTRQAKNAELAVQLDPKGALGNSILSSAYLGISRENDDTNAALRAEHFARRSLALRSLGNIGARNKLIQSLLQQHQFARALHEAETALVVKSFDDSTLRLHAECLIEVGQVAKANAVVSAHPRAFGHASGQAITARLLDLAGRPQNALELMAKATQAVDTVSSMPSDAVAWFHIRNAALLAKYGQHQKAEREYRISLELYPRNYRALGGLSRLAAMDRRWSDVIRWGKASNAIAPMVDIEALVGDAYAMLGDQREAMAHYDAVAAQVGRPSGMTESLHEVSLASAGHGHRLDRQYAVFCADHDRDLDGAYAASLRDIGSRKDIYAFDTLAWVQAKRGNLAEAKRASQRALSLGTQDPILLFHAGEISRLGGDLRSATRYFRALMHLDPRFDGFAAPRVARFLAAQGDSTDKVGGQNAHS